MVGKPEDIMVSVKMVTYNHIDYIEQAIKSVIDQKTNFKIKLNIGDDCSQDGTSEIITGYQKEFPEIINHTCHQNRIGAYENNLLTIDACKGKYIAFCDGDDFWPCDDKLQKQIDYLEARPDVGMVYSDVNIVDENNKQINESPVYKDSYQSGEIFWPLMKNCFINANTTCIRNNLVKPLIPRSKEEKSKLWYIYDYWLWLQLAVNHKIDYLKNTTATYRVHKQGISRNSSFFRQRAPLARLDAINKLKRSDLDTHEKKAFVFGKLLVILIDKQIKLSTKKVAFSNLIRLHLPMSVLAMKYKNRTN